MGESMFSDPFTAVMALIILAFIGTLAVFFRIWRECDSLRASIRELKDTMRLYAVEASQQNQDLAAALRELRAGVIASPKPEECPDEACLGALLEKGLPNIMGGSARFPEPRADTPASAAHREDEDLIRRLGDGLDKGTA